MFAWICTVLAPSMINYMYRYITDSIYKVVITKLLLVEIFKPDSKLVYTYLVSWNYFCLLWWCMYIYICDWVYKRVFCMCTCPLLRLLRIADVKWSCNNSLGLSIFCITFAINIMNRHDQLNRFCSCFIWHLLIIYKIYT